MSPAYFGSHQPVSLSSYSASSITCRGQRTWSLSHQLTTSTSYLHNVKHLGPEHLVNVDETSDVIGIIRDLTDGGAHVSIDCPGIPATCTNSVRSLRKRGRHVQLGWMLADDSTPPISMDLVMGWELEIVGSHDKRAGMTIITKFD